MGNNHTLKLNHIYLEPGLKKNHTYLEHGLQKYCLMMFTFAEHKEDQNMKGPERLAKSKRNSITSMDLHFVLQADFWTNDIGSSRDYAEGHVLFRTRCRQATLVLAWFWLCKANIAPLHVYSTFLTGCNLKETQNGKPFLPWL